MNKTTVYVVAVVALVVGLALGYVGAAAFGSAGAGRVRNAKLEVGDEAPNFRLRDHTGRTIELSDYAGKQNVVLAFLPGAFTPI
jgi:cytochrome oxidase Cu insertion factor (SCO1/SenC/PrrC family)